MNAYQTWHCGNDDCDGFELEPLGNDHLNCSQCGRVYDHDGNLQAGDDPDEDPGETEGHWGDSIEAARTTAAVRNQQMFGTDPSWYGR